MTRFIHFNMKIIPFAHNHTANNVHKLLWLLTSLHKLSSIVVPRLLTGRAHKAENGSLPRAETSPLLWRAADRVTARKQVRQNSFVLQAYFDIGLFGGL